MLIANPTDQPLGCAFAGFDATAEVRQVDDTSSSVQQLVARSSGITLPPYAVQIVILPRR